MDGKTVAPLLDRQRNAGVLSVSTGVKFQRMREVDFKSKNKIFKKVSASAMLQNRTAPSEIERNEDTKRP